MGDRHPPVLDGAETNPSSPGSLELDVDQGHGVISDKQAPFF
jgi:hypothetical protein